MPPSRDYSWLLRNDYTRATASEEAPLSTKRKRAAGGQNDHASSFEYTITPDAAKSAKRRRTRLAAASGRHDVIDLTESEPQQPGPSTPKRKRKQAQRTPGSGESIEEKRLRMFRDHPPQTFEVKLQRARTQRMFVVDRKIRGGDDDPEEQVDIAGTTGNIYTVIIGKEPSCTCPDARKGNQCKHIVYVRDIFDSIPNPKSFAVVIHPPKATIVIKTYVNLTEMAHHQVLYNVLKAPEHLQYQLALLSSELREIFSNAPPNPSDSSSSNDEDGKRKPIEGDCPICFMEFEPEKEEIVWCRTACGNNIHKACFNQWAAASTSGIRCVYCRSHWEEEHGSMQQLLQGASVNEEGYLNVGEELGLSDERDYSTYHQRWGRRRYSPYYY